MTRTQAIWTLIDCRRILIDGLVSVQAEEITEAFDMAIDALKYLEAMEGENQMNDLISRQDAIKVLKSNYDLLERATLRTDMARRDEISAMMAKIMSLPSAEPKTGKWVMLERVENVHDIYGVPTWGVNYMCDNCGFIHTAIQDHFSQYKHCPKCGARMKGADDEREDIQSTDE